MFRAHTGSLGQKHVKLFDMLDVLLLLFFPSTLPFVQGQLHDVPALACRARMHVEHDATKQSAVWHSGKRVHVLRLLRFCLGFRHLAFNPVL